MYDSMMTASMRFRRKKVAKKIKEIQNMAGTNGYESYFIRLYNTVDQLSSDMI